MQVHASGGGQAARRAGRELNDVGVIWAGCRPAHPHRPQRLAAVPPRRHFNRQLSAISVCGFVGDSRWAKIASHLTGDSAVAAKAIRHKADA